MFVRTICFPVTVLGPGRRLGIWLSGCSKRCPGCMSPELQRRRDSDEVPFGQIRQLVASRSIGVEGVTISGGEPFEQNEELYRLVAFLKASVTDDILVYTGWTLQDVLADKWGSKTLPLMATLIDGEYIAEKDCGIGLRGSTNQVVHRINPSYDFDYERCERCVQSFVYENKVFMAGLR